MMAHYDIRVILSRLMLHGNLAADCRVTLYHHKLIIQKPASIHGDRIYNEKLSQIMAKRRMVCIPKDTPLFLYDFFRCIASGKTYEKLGIIVDKMSCHSLRKPRHHVAVHIGRRMYGRKNRKTKVLHGHGSGNFLIVHRIIRQQCGALHIYVTLLRKSVDICYGRLLDIRISVIILFRKFHPCQLNGTHIQRGRVQIIVDSRQRIVLRISLFTFSVQIVACLPCRFDLCDNRCRILQIPHLLYIDC